MSKKKVIFLISLLPLSLCVGFLERGPMSAIQYANMLTLGYALISIGLIFLWYRSDKIERGYDSSLFLSSMIVCLTVFALPYYLFRSRGILGGTKALALSLLVFMSTMTAYRAGFWLG